MDKDNNTSEIRQLITATFTDEELIILCFDHFRPVHEKFADGWSRTMKIQALIESTGIGGGATCNEEAYNEEASPCRFRIHK